MAFIQIVTRDRNNPDRHLAETRTLAEKYRAATKDTRFHDLDVISDSGL